MSKTHVSLRNGAVKMLYLQFTRLDQAGGLRCFLEQLERVDLLLRRNSSSIREPEEARLEEKIPLPPFVEVPPLYVHETGIVSDSNSSASDSSDSSDSDSIHDCFEDFPDISDFEDMLKSQKTYEFPTNLDYNINLELFN